MAIVPTLKILQARWHGDRIQVTTKTDSGRDRILVMEAHQLVHLEPNPNIEEFQPGDTVRVEIRVTEGERTRLQAFQGVVIRKRGGGPGASFTVRRVSYEIGVERTFLLHSPNVESVTVTRRGKVRRSRLYYLRGRSGRAARIKERRYTG